jgi:hypothetical protein
VPTAVVPSGGVRGQTTSCAPSPIWAPSTANSAPARRPPPTATSSSSPAAPPTDGARRRVPGASSPPDEDAARSEGVSPSRWLPALIRRGRPRSDLLGRGARRPASAGAPTSRSSSRPSTRGQPLPFGADRALLGWIQTLALQGGPTVRFDRLSDFFRAFGLASSGREYRIFRERLSRLCGLSITVRLSAEDGDRQLSMIPIKKSFTPGAGDEARTVLRSEASQLLLVPRSYGLELDPDFYQYLCEHPVPLPMPIMRLFHNSPKAWDFAQIVLYRSYAASTACVMTWPELLDQMSSEDTALSRLKATLRQVLREIQTVYPGFPARFLPARQGLRIELWRPPTASSRS